MSKSIHFFVNRVKYAVKNKGELILWLDDVISDFEKQSGEINFIVTNDKSINKINIQYLNTDTFTDVITFNFSEEDAVVSGDVYISIERVEENAKKFRVSVEEEFRRILIHGILHLLGYNDSVAKDKRRMTRLENKFLRRYNQE